MLKFKGKKILITGAGRSQSLGSAIAIAFAQEGADIIIAYNSSTKEPEEIISRINEIYHKQNHAGKAKAIKADLGDEKSRYHLIDESYKFLGEVDILVNNAGIGIRKKFIDLSQEEIRKLFEINFFAPFFLMQECTKRMIQKQEALQKQGHSVKDYCIINITSISKALISLNLSSYETSKAALHQLTKSTAMELAKFNIRINDVAPGLVATNSNRMQRESDPVRWQRRIEQIPLNRSVAPADIAQSVLFVAANTSMTGATMTVDGGRMCNWSGREINFHS